MLLSLAWRNLNRYRRRSVVTAVSVVLASFLVCSLRFLGYGMHQQMVWQTAGILSGYVQVAAYGWLESRTIERALDVPESLLAELRALPGVYAIAPRIEASALAAVREESRFVTVTALDSQIERELTGLHTRMIQGRFLLPEGAVISDKRGVAAPREAIVGHRLARLLGVKLGEELFVVTTQFDGSVGAARLRLVGIFRTHNPDLDSSRIVIGLGTGRDLFAPDGDDGRLRRNTSLVLGVHTMRSAENLVQLLTERFRPPNEPGVPPEESSRFSPVVHSWEDLNPELVQMMALDQVGNELWIAFLILIMAFGVLNGVHMSISERTREFGILMAIGFAPRLILRLVVLETILILIPAAFIGTLLAMGAAAYLQLHPIPLGGEWADSLEGFGFQPVVQAVVDPGELVAALVSLFLPALIFVYYGARRVLRLDPAVIMRTT